LPANSGPRRLSGKLRRSNWKVKQQVYSQLRCRIEEVRGVRSIDAQSCDGHSSVTDRRNHVSVSIDTRDELETAVVEDVDQGGKSVGRLRNYEVKVARYPARPENHQSHPSDEHRFKSERAKPRLDLADNAQVFERLRHVTLAICRVRATVRQMLSDAARHDAGREARSRQRHIGSSRRCAMPSGLL